jgi:hypothetical protein
MMNRLRKQSEIEIRQAVLREIHCAVIMALDRLTQEREAEEEDQDEISESQERPANVVLFRRDSKSGL